MRQGLRCRWSSLLFVLVLSFLAGSILSPAARAEDKGNWPQEFKAEGGYKVVMYQPQPDSMEGNIVTARTAVSVQGKDQKEPVFGAVFFTVKLDIDREKD